MLSRAKYFVPVGVGMVMFNPSVVLAQSEDSNPAPKLKRTPWDVYCEPPSKECKKTTGQASELEKTVKKTREEVVKPLTEDIQSYLMTGHAAATQVTGAVRDNIKYLQTSAPEEIRMAAIAGGTVLGFVLGIRKSFFRKLIYAGVLGSSTAAVIYPKEAKIFAKEGYTYARGFIKNTIATMKDGRFDDSVQSKKSRKDKCSSTVSDK